MHVRARRSGRHSWTGDWPTSSPSRTSIAAEVANELRRRVQGGLQPRAYTRHEPPIEAQLAFLQGRAALARHTVRGSLEAAEKFERAIELDPQFAAALAGLFDARMLAAERRHDDLAAEHRRQSPLLERALEIDPDCGPAYVARAIWDPSDATRREADFRRGLELDPSNGRGLVAFSEFLDSQGRYDEGTKVLDRAMLVDPLSPRLHFRLVMREFGRKEARFKEAGLKHVLEIDPDYQPALQRYGKTRWRLHGRMAEAAQVLEHAIEVDPDNPWSRHTAMALYLDLGDEASAREVANGTESSRRTGQLLLALYRGDSRTAGEVAFSPAGQEYNLAESWGAVEAVRDYALRTGDFRRASSSSRSVTSSRRRRSRARTSRISGRPRTWRNCCRRPVTTSRATGCSTGCPPKSTHRFRATAPCSHSGPRHRCSCWPAIGRRACARSRNRSRPTT